MYSMYVHVYSAVHCDMLKAMLLEKTRNPLIQLIELSKWKSSEEWRGAVGVLLRW